MSSPEPKKAKLDSEDISSYYYTEQDGTHDRILLVENTKFYVLSKKLMEYSEYFRAMLTSDFIEKQKEIIELKEFKVEQIKMLLDAIFKQEEVEINVSNIEKIVELFVYFQAIDSLIKMLKRDELFEMVPAKNLLKLAENFGVKELKDSVEHWLVVQIRNCYEYKDRVARNRQKARDFRFEDLALEGLELAEKYQLTRLQNKIDFEMAHEYKYSAHFATTEDEHLKLLEKYGLVKLTANIETYAIERFASDQKGVVKKYLKGEKKIQMEKLKEVSENHFMAEFEKVEFRFPPHFTEYLNLCKKYDYQQLKVCFY